MTENTKNVTLQYCNNRNERNPWNPTFFFLKYQVSTPYYAGRSFQSKIQSVKDSKFSQRLQNPRKIDTYSSASRRNKFQNTEALKRYPGILQTEGCRQICWIEVLLSFYSS